MVFFPLLRESDTQQIKVDMPKLLGQDDCRLWRLRRIKMRLNVIITVIEKDVGLEASHVGCRRGSLKLYFTDTSHWPQGPPRVPSPSYFIRKRVCILFKSMVETLEGPMTASGFGSIQDRASSVCLRTVS